MQLSNYYYYFKSALSAEICNKILHLGLNKIAEEKKQGINVTGHTGGFLEKSAKPNAKPQNEKSLGNLIKDGEDPEQYYVRDSEVTWLTDKWIYDIIFPLAKHANELAGWNFEISGYENIQFTTYQSPGGFYGWHRDGSSDLTSAYKRYIDGISPPLLKDNILPEGYTRDPSWIGKVRKLSLTINLNPEGSYTGGNLKFDWGRHVRTNEQYYECTEIRPQGSMIVFPSFLYHCVTPVLTGTRCSLVLWLLGRHFK